MAPSSRLENSKKQAGFMRANLLVVALLSALPYLSKFGNGLLLWDDKRFIIRRELIHSLGNIPQFFITGIDGLYRPGRAALYALAYQLFSESPYGYQAVGILLHVSCAVFFYLIIRRLLENESLALVAGAVFALHPIHVERVGGVTASFDLLGDALLLAALYLYAATVRATDEKSRRVFFGAVLAASVFSSEMGVVFLPMMVAMDFVAKPGFGGFKRRGIVADYLVAWGVVSAYLVCRFSVLGTIDRGIGRPAEGFFYNLLTVAAGHLEYIKTFFLHWQLTYFHEVTVAGQGAVLPGLIALGIQIALLVSALVCKNKLPAFAFGVFWFFIALLPFSQLLPNRPVVQERYAYLPVGGYAIFLGFLYTALKTRLKVNKFRTALTAVGVVFLALLFVTTWDRTGMFKDDFTLWSVTLKDAPNHAGTHNNLAVALMDLNRCEEALPLVLKSARLDEKFELAWRNLGRCYSCLKRNEEARQAYLRYLQLVPDDLQVADKFFRLGLSLGDTESVIRDIEGLFAANKGQPPLLLTLAMAYTKAGQTQKAEAVLARYRQAVPGDRAAAALKKIIEEGSNS